MASMSDMTPNGPMVAVQMDPDILKRIEFARGIITNDFDRYQELSDYHDGDQLAPFAPAHASAETMAIRKRSVMNLMRLAVQVPAQLSFADGFFRNKELFPKEWNVGWVDAGFAAKQTILYVAALKYGVAYVGLENLGNKAPVPKIYATKNTVALYSDPVNDLHPVYLFSQLSKPLDEKNPGRAVYMDAERIQYFDIDSEKGIKPRPGEDYPHDLGVCPAVRYVVDLDDEGRTRGAIDPLIELQDAVNQGKFNFLINNQFAATKVRWASGMTGEPMKDENGAIVRDDQGKIVFQAIEVSPSRFLSTEAADGKFGTLDETESTGFIAAMEELIKEFAVAAQLPPHSLLGSLANLSAETLVAAMAQTMRFSHILKTTWGQSHRALLRLVALDLGEVTADDEYVAEVRWRDMSDIAFAQQMDGLGKAAQMLGIPRRGLWRLFPGATTAIIEQWEDLADKEEQDLREQALDSPTPGGAAQRERRPAAPVTGGTTNGNSAGA